VEVKLFLCHFLTLSTMASASGNVFYVGFNQVSHQISRNQLLENYLVKNSGVRRTWMLLGKQGRPQLNWIQKDEQ
jgi:hypothetical protein